MPKRKKDKRSDSEYEYLAKKVRKLEQKIKHSRRQKFSVKSDSSSMDCDSPSPRNRLESESIATVDDNLPGCSFWDDWPEISTDEVRPGAPTTADLSPLPPTSSLEIPLRAVVQTTVAAAIPTAAATDNAPTATAAATVATATVAATAAAAAAAPATTPQPAPLASTEPAATPTTATDPDLLDIFGEDPTSTNEYGNDINNDLAIRITHVVTSGLSKENRKELKDKYLVPANCKRMKAPSLNPEIKAFLAEMDSSGAEKLNKLSKRDSGIENKQTLTSCALSSLTSAMTLLLASEHKNKEVLKILMDTVRLLGHMQHSDSALRRFFILSTMKKEMKDQLEKTKVDEMLFGSDLTETLKLAKVISKSAADLRPTTTVSKNNAQKAAKAQPYNRPLNSRAPPASRQAPAPPLGSARHPRAAPPARPPATTSQRNSYKTSSRQPPPRYRR